MEIIPAIDLRDGKCVRLYQGDYGKETVYFDDPVEVAFKWQEAGAPRIHVVDLDGAAAGRPGNLEVVRRIAETVRVPLQVGGGIRVLNVAEEVLGMGVQRIVLGTTAVEDSILVEEACRRFGAEAVVVGVDSRDGKVAVRGWQQASELSALDLMRRMANMGVRRFIFTDISRDGTLTEPNFQAIQEVVEGSGMTIIASGGVSSIEHLKRLASLGVEGAIVGKALYTGAIDLREALSAL